MIKYHEAEMIDVLPSVLKENTDIQAISYAFAMAVRKLLGFNEYVCSLTVIDKLPEDILDLVALEQRTQYYDNGLDIEKKRELVKETLYWHRTAGTVAAVNEMIQIVFGEGEAVPWWQYERYYAEITWPNLLQGTFVIKTAGELTFENYSHLLAVMENVKNAKSQLLRVVSEKEMGGTKYVGVHLNPIKEIELWDERLEENNV